MTSRLPSASCRPVRRFHPADRTIRWILSLAFLPGLAAADWNKTNFPFYMSVTCMAEGQPGEIWAGGADPALGGPNVTGMLPAIPQVLQGLAQARERGLVPLLFHQITTQQGGSPVGLGIAETAGALVHDRP